MQMREFCRDYIVAYNLTDDESTIKFRLKRTGSKQGGRYAHAARRQPRSWHMVASGLACEQLIRYLLHIGKRRADAKRARKIPS